MKANLILLILFISGVLATPVSAQQVYVSGNGNDSNPGSIDLPFKTIQQAIDKTVGGECTIILREGIYQIDKTIQISPENSGLTLKPYNREQVILSAGKPINDWELVRHPSPGKNRPNRVWKATLHDLPGLLTLYDQSGILQRCASPKFKTVENKVESKEGGNVEVKMDESENPTPSKLFFLKDQIDHVKDFNGAELFILPSKDWVANYLPIATVDKDRRIIETVCPGTYALATPPTWTQVELFYQIENVPEFLDEPGEWYFNKAKGELYLISRTGEKPEGIIVPGLNQIINISGDLGKSDLVKNVTIEGLTFKHAERMTWEDGRIGVQHDWEVLDGEWSCIKAKGVSGLLVKNCLFENTGGDGVRIDLEGWNNTICNNEFVNVGGSAISLIGYPVGTRDKLHSNKIVSNYIHHCSTLWWLQAGITICQSSANLIANNLIHDMPYNGMAFVGGRSAFFGRGRNSNSPADGLSYVNWDEIPGDVDAWYEKVGYVNTRDNIIEHNEAYNVMQKLGDGNAIYLSGTGSGNILRKNYIHDIHSLSSAGGMRFDNDTWFCVMRDNVVWNVNGSNLVAKHVNTVENNIMVNSGVRSSMNLAAGPKWGTNIRHNIIVNSKELLDSTKNKWQKMDEIFAKGELEECIITDNLLYVSDDNSFGVNVTKSINSNFNASNNIHANPQFYDIENGDFRLKKDSPALKLGFVPFDDYGLTAPVGRIINR